MSLHSRHQQVMEHRHAVTTASGHVRSKLILKSQCRGFFLLTPQYVNANDLQSSLYYIWWSQTTVYSVAIYFGNVLWIFLVVERAVSEVQYRCIFSFCHIHSLTHSTVPFIRPALHNYSSHICAVVEDSKLYFQT